MKEMKYQFERKIEVLDTGFCFGLLYYILNLGTHPTAYIKMPDNINIDEDKLDIKLDVHGGITYFDDHLWISKNQKNRWKIYWLGLCTLWRLCRI